MDEYLPLAEDYNGKKVLIFKVENLDVNALKDLVDRLADKLGDSVVFACNVVSPKVVFVCKNKISNLKAGELVKKAATITLGGGGGRDDFAQAGGKDETKVPLALEEVKKLIGDKLCE